LRTVADEGTLGLLTQHIEIHHEAAQYSQSLCSLQVALLASTTTGGVARWNRRQSDDDDCYATLPAYTKIIGKHRSTQNQRCNSGTWFQDSVSVV
jgi:hypothetical protein